MKISRRALSALAGNLVLLGLLFIGYGSDWLAVLWPPSQP